MQKPPSPDDAGLLRRFGGVFRYSRRALELLAKSFDFALSLVLICLYLGEPNPPLITTMVGAWAERAETLR